MALTLSSRTSRRRPIVTVSKTPWLISSYVFDLEMLSVWAASGMLQSNGLTWSILPPSISAQTLAVLRRYKRKTRIHRRRTRLIHKNLALRLVEQGKSLRFLPDALVTDHHIEVGRPQDRFMVVEDHLEERASRLPWE
jgi:hypothetical protein